jgi:hypothetical protein
MYGDEGRCRVGEGAFGPQISNPEISHFTNSEKQKKVEIKSTSILHLEKNDSP